MKSEQFLSFTFETSIQGLAATRFFKKTLKQESYAKICLEKIILTVKSVKISLLMKRCLSCQEFSAACFSVSFFDFFLFVSPTRPYTFMQLNWTSCRYIVRFVCQKLATSTFIRFVQQFSTNNSHQISNFILQPYKTLLRIEHNFFPVYQIVIYGSNAFFPFSKERL